MTPPEPEVTSRRVGHADSTPSTKSPLFWGAVGVAVLAVLGLVVYLASGPSKKTVNEAIGGVCTSVGEANKGVGRIQNRKVANNPAAKQSHATEVRQAFGLASSYLTTALELNPATPDELAWDVRKLAYSYQLRAINSLNGVGGASAKPARTMTRDASKAIREFCAERAPSAE